MKTPILETERLILRPISLDDAPALQKYFNEWEIIKYLHAPWPYPDDGAVSHLRDQTLPAMDKGKQIAWAITLKKTEDFIGRIDYRFYEDKEPDRGFWIAIPFQGRGFMTEAVAASQDYIFYEYGLERFVVKNLQSNIGSRRVKEKTGAIFKKLQPKSCSHHLDEPTEIWEVTKESWEAARKKLGL